MPKDKSKKTVAEAVIWLVIGLVLIVVPLLFSFIAVFPMIYAETLQYIAVLMHVLFAGGFMMLFMPPLKSFKKGYIYYLLVSIAVLLVPVLFAVMVIMPVVSSVVTFTYVLMHVVFAAGFVTIYTQWKKISKVF